MPLQHWHNWNESGRKRERLTPLLDAFRPLVGREVERWSPSGLPPIVLESEAKRLIIQGVKTFDPSRKVPLPAHLNNQLKGMDRFVNQHRLDIRLPQEKVHLADKVFRAKQQLELELGREVTNREIAERAGIGITTIGKLKKFQTSLYSQAEGAGFNQPVKEDISTDVIVVGFLYQDLTPQQQIVFDYLTGQHGKPQLSPGEIASRVGISPARVSPIRNQIAEKARRYQRAVGHLMS